MATGRSNKITGAVGEFLVAAELNRRGLLATPFSGNVPHYDIIASGEHGGHLPIQVKAVNKYTWQFDVSRFVEISFDGDKQILGQRLPTPYPDLFCVFVAIGDDHKSDRYFIFTWRALVDTIIDHHQRYLDKHSGVRPKNPRSTHCSIAMPELQKFENDWDLIVRAVHKAAAQLGR
ncbi:MAG: hypothetical protein HLX48_02245 [Halomonas sp.]|uniref:hypothetical protein n=1 Tax=Halomonas sp. TaxID=1486246 RepID=UPI001840AC3F|nr:hypothetical protein [Halomonas sp.]NWN81803.1 hypothetical protein [Halomonas sp.]